MKYRKHVNGYKKALQKFRENNPDRGAFLDPDPGNIFLAFVSQDGKSGVYVKNDGEIGGLFNDAEQSRGSELIEKAVQHGGNHLDCFDGFLPDYYRRHGFNEKNRVEWNDDHAPENWNYNKFGRPDVIIMELEDRDAATTQSKGMDLEKTLAMDLAELQILRNYGFDEIQELVHR